MCVYVCVVGLPKGSWGWDENKTKEKNKTTEEKVWSREERIVVNHAPSSAAADLVQIRPAAQRLVNEMRPSEQSKERGVAVRLDMCEYYELLCAACRLARIHYDVHIYPRVAQA